MFKNDDERDHHEKVCLFAHLTVRMMLMTGWSRKWKFVFSPMNDHSDANDCRMQLNACDLQNRGVNERVFALLIVDRRKWMRILR